ncbi:MAG: hypothetical protein O3A14_04245 [Cyanobacteria bacterium]|nr:hypothetical protein [Cyanobacteriota bacterium]
MGSFQTYYLLRSKQDGRHLAARAEANQTYLLLFTADYDALSYLNTHAGEVSDRFAIETISAPQLKAALSRWGFTGIGLVRDPLIPRIDFMNHAPGP